MKKLGAFLLAVILLLALTACGSSGDDKIGTGFTVKETLQPGPAPKNTDEPKGENPTAIEPESESPLEQEVGITDTPSDFSNLPATEDKAEYLQDGRLRLLSNGIEIIFQIPDGWFFLTQDALGQQADYEMWIDDPAEFVALMQGYEQNGFGLTDMDDEIDFFILQDGFSRYIEDTDNVNSDNVDELVAELKEDNEDASDIYFTMLGDRVFVVYEYESEGYLIASTVINSISLDFYYTPGENSGDDELQAFGDFLSNLEIRLA